MFGFKTIHDQELIDLMSAQGQITKALKLSALLLFLKDRVGVLPRRLLRPIRQNEKLSPKLNRFNIIF